MSSRRNGRQHRPRLADRHRPVALNEDVVPQEEAVPAVLLSCAGDLGEAFRLGEVGDRDPEAHLRMFARDPRLPFHNGMYRGRITPEDDYMPLGRGRVVSGVVVRSRNSPVSACRHVDASWGEKVVG